MSGLHLERITTGNQNEAAFTRLSRREFLQTAAAAGVLYPVAAMSDQTTRGRSVVSLNGAWKIYFDEAGRWSKSNWIDDFLSSSPRPVSIDWDMMHAAMDARASEIRVPATWEEYRSNTVGEAWYWREISIPESEGDRVTRLVFNAARYGAEVFLDGHRVALSLGGFTPFTADLTPLTRARGRHQLIVHVTNPGGGEAGNWQTLFLENVQIPQSHNFGGIWQDVNLISTSPVFIEDVFVEPRIAEKMAVAHVRVRNQTALTQEVSLSARATSHDAARLVAGRAELAVQVPTQQSVAATLRLALDPFKLWEPANPFRYRLEASLRGSSPLIADQAGAGFGLREFTARGRFFYLNGRKFMVKSTINHQYYPVTVGYPATPELARKEIEVALHAGLNMMHIHRQIGHPLLLESADELGLLLYEEPGGVIFDTTHHLDYPGIKLLLRQLGDLVIRDRNHPALVAWGMSNENSVDEEVVKSMMQTTRELDPTRVVCDNSGEGRKMLLPYDKQPRAWRDFHCYPPAPIDHSVYSSLASNGGPPDYAFRIADALQAPSMSDEGPQIVGEFGYGGLPDLPGTLAKFAATRIASVEGANEKESLQSLEEGFRRHGLDKELGNVTDFCRLTEEVHATAQAEMLQAFRSNPFNSGYAVSCFHDLAIWYCGITDVFRDPKPICERLAQVNAPLSLVLYADPAPTWTDAPVRVQCAVVNEGVIEGSVSFHITIAGPAGEKVFDETARLDLRPEKSFVVPAFEKTLALKGSSGHYNIQAELEHGGAVKARSERAVLALNGSDVKWPSAGILVYDPTHRILPFLAGQRAPYQLWSQETPAQGHPILVADIERWYYYEHRQSILEDARRILEQCREGSVVSFLIDSANDGLIALLNESGVHPKPLRMVDSFGDFRGDFHFVKPHPLFRSLPTKVCMNSEYRNVIARVSLDGFEGEPIVVCNENAYWWGTDMGVLRWGKGAVVLSTLRIAPSLSLDPIAAVLLANLAGWELS
jgi:hypothetical protein